MRYFDFVCAGFSFTTSITIAMLAEQKAVKFVPIEYHKREGSSHVRYVRDTARSLQISLQCILRYNPLKAFLALSLVSLFPALLFLVLALWQPLALVGACMFGCTMLLTMGLGMLAYATGRQTTGPVDAGVYSHPEIQAPPEPQKSIRAA
jgi:hypothetical protein